MKYRDLVRIMEIDGWHQVRKRGSHRQYQHPIKTGTVTIAPHSMGDEVPRPIIHRILKKAGLL